jgi:hypothetical protein
MDNQKLNVDISRIVEYMSKGFPELKYDTLSHYPNSLLGLYHNWYVGLDPAFHNYNVKRNGLTVECTKKRLELGKLACSEWASLLRFEESEITIDSDAKESEFLQDVLLDNNFFHRTSIIMEYTMAHGSSVAIPVMNDFGDIDLILLSAFDFDVIQFNNRGEVTGISFVFNDGRRYVQFMVKGVGAFEFIVDGKDITLNNIYDQKHPTFAYFKTTEASKSYLDKFPQSILVKAIPVLKLIDEVWDSLHNEFELGLKKILVPEEFATKEVILGEDEDGNPIMETLSLFDRKSSQYLISPSDNMDDENKPEAFKEISFEIRSKEHIETLRILYSMFSQSVGLGSNYFSFNGESLNIQTATQVVSNKSETFRNLKKFETSIEGELKKLVKSIFLVSGKTVDITDVKVKFDDSLITDDEKERLNAIMEKQAGLRSTKSYLSDVRNLGEDEVLLEMANMEEEKQQALEMSKDASLDSGKNLQSSTEEPPVKNEDGN